MYICIYKNGSCLIAGERAETSHFLPERHMSQYMDKTTTARTFEFMALKESFQN